MNRRRYFAIYTDRLLKNALLHWSNACYTGRSALKAPFISSGNTYPYRTIVSGAPEIIVPMGNTFPERRKLLS